MYLRYSACAVELDSLLVVYTYVRRPVIPAPAEVASCIYTVLIDGHAHLLIGNA